jgi:CRISPR-associated protein Cmr6
MKLPLPFDTQSVLKDKNNILRTSNLGLLFNKYFYSWQNGWKIEEKNSKEFRQDIRNIVSKIPKDHLSSIYKRQTALIQGLKDSGWQVESFEMITDVRLIIGLGGTSVIETGMTLHPLYGFPYLPASGLKGLARAYAEIVVEPKPSGEEVKEIFGSKDKDPHKTSENHQGKVFFMDGLPIQFPELELDIMNPHFSDYYQGKKDTKGNPIPPADYSSPVPVTFLTVAVGQSFSFAVFSRDKSFVQKAEKWLIGGLTELGAGGKTNVGYGYFMIPEQQVVKPVSVVQKKDDPLLTKLKSVKNAETFAAFIKQLGTEDIDVMSVLSFAGMESVINIGLVSTLEATEGSQEMKRVIAKKMLEVCKKPDKKYAEKFEKYKKLLSIAGEKLE